MTTKQERWRVKMRAQGRCVQCGAVSLGYRCRRCKPSKGKRFCPRCGAPGHYTKSCALPSEADPAHPSPNPDDSGRGFIGELSPLPDEIPHHDR